MRAVLVVLLVAGTASLASATTPVNVGPFTFSLPDGWMHIDHKNADLPPELKAMARQVDMYAVDPASADDGFAENVNVLIRPCPGRFTKDVVDMFARQFPAYVKQQDPTASASVREHALVKFSGVNGGRFIVDEQVQGITVRLVQYHLPSKNKCAIATYTSTPEQFDRYLPIFDAAIAETRGLAEAPASKGFWSRIGDSALEGAIIGGIAGGIGALLFGLGKRKKKQAENQADKP